MATSSPVSVEVAERIRRHGPRSFEEVVDLALYHPEHGFYATVGSAGRRGDFITSPEVGPLFGAVVARALDAWWDDLGRPDPFTVVEAGAGRGALAIAVRAAHPECLGALTYVLVERSPRLRAAQGEHLRLTPPALALPSAVADDARPPLGGTGPRFTSLAELPAGRLTGVVVANELLDNLAFRLLVFDGRWRESWVATSGDSLVEVLRECDPPPFALPERPAHGSRVPWQRAAGEWTTDVLGRLVGRLVVFDYAVMATSELAVRPWRDWLRTYRGQERGAHYLRDAGSQDITTDVCVDQLIVACGQPDAVRSQTQFLQRWGIDDLVEEGRRVWNAEAARPGLNALRMRSRISEAEALSDPAGLGGFTVLEWVRVDP